MKLLSLCCSQKDICEALITRFQVSLFTRFKLFFYLICPKCNENIESQKNKKQNKTKQNKKQDQQC